MTDLEASMSKLKSAAECAITAVEKEERLDEISEPVAAAVKKATGRRGVKNLLSGTWLGHALHPMLTDVPIGSWLAASVLDLTAGDAGADAARRLTGFGVLAAVPAAASGASDWSDSYGAEQRAGLVHGLANSVGTTLQMASWFARRRGARGAGTVLSLAGLGITLAAAYLGGHLSFVRGTGVNRTAFDEPADSWVDVAAETELSSDKPVRVDADGVAVVLVKHEDTIRALSATCTHAGGPLDEGHIDDAGCIVCPWHGSRFRLRDGAAMRGPASVDEPRWDVRVADGRVSVRAAD